MIKHWDWEATLVIKHWDCEVTLVIKHWDCEATLVIKHWDCEVTLVIKHWDCEVTLVIKHKYVTHKRSTCNEEQWSHTMSSNTMVRQDLCLCPSTSSIIQ